MTDYFERLLEELVNSILEQTRENIDAKCKFEVENNALIAVLSKLDIHVKDENGNFRPTLDVLKDVGEVYYDLCSHRPN